MNSALLFDELLVRLRHEGFSTGTDQYLRMHELFERYSDATPQQLASLLCPIFATSAEEQGRFRQAYDEFFAVRARSRGPRTVPGTIPGNVMLPKTSRPRWKWWIAGLLAVAILTLRGGQALLPVHKNVSVQKTQGQTGSSVFHFKTKRVEKTPEEIARSHPRLLVAGGIVVLLFAAEIMRTLLRWSRQRDRRAKGRPFDWPLRDPNPTAPRLFADARFFRTSRMMKAREAGDVQRLDVLRSVLATIRNLGDPLFEYVAVRRVSEYLVLVERLSERDHLATFVEAMLDALARDGVLVEVYEHDGDPRHCWKPGTTTRIVTTDLFTRYPQHRLVIIGSGAALTDPVTGEAVESIPRIFPWSARGLLTLEEEGRAARCFESFFEVYGLANDGLARLVERWQSDVANRLPERRRAKERRRSSSNLPAQPDELQVILGTPLFDWLLRCAVHPSLHWDLTRALAPPMPAAQHEAALLELSRLEWFREGRIPEPVRLALVTQLAADETIETSARTTAMRILAAAPPPPAASVAARVFEIQQLAHKIWLARDRVLEARPLVRALRRYAPSHVSRDGALMMLLHDAPGTFIARAAPQSLRRMLFGHGVPAFGMRNFLGLIVLVPLVAFLTMALRDPDVWMRTIRVPIAVPTTARVEPPRPKEPSSRQVAESPRNRVGKPSIAPGSTRRLEDSKTPPLEKSTRRLEASTTPPLEKSPRRLEVPKPPPLIFLPTPLQPRTGETLEFETLPTVIDFAWQPAGSYTLIIRNALGVKVAQFDVSGTSAQWKLREAGERFSWTLTAPDGRTTDAQAFNVHYIVAAFTPGFVTVVRTKIVTHPISCKPTEGTHRVNLELNPREIFEGVRVTAEKTGLASADVEILERGPVTVYRYRFMPAEPCHDDGKLTATVRIDATLRLETKSATP